MERLSIAIVSSDEAYNKALALSLLSVYRDFDIKNFGNREFLTKCSNYKGRGAFYDRFDVVLWAGEEISESYEGNIVYLTEKASQVRMDCAKKRFCIYKYNPANKIIASIFDIYTQLTGRSAAFVRNTDVRLFAFAAAMGGVGCTTLAIGVSQELSRFYGKKVLYLTMEDVESTPDMMEIPLGSKHLGEFLYRLLADRRNMGVEPQNSSQDGMPFPEAYTLMNPYKVEAFVSGHGKNPLRELSVEDMQKFIAALMDCGRYDIIIMDLSSCLTDAGLAAMYMAERICLVAKCGRRGHREENYLSQVICCGGEKTLDKFMRIENMYPMENASIVTSQKEDDSVQSDEILKTKLRIKKAKGERFIGKGGLEGEFGLAISKLTELLLGI